MASNVLSSVSSPPSSAENAAAVLTPSKKVQALLAQFSDSDSDNTKSCERNQDITSLSATGAAGVVESESEDDIIPRSRLTARLLGHLDPEAANTTATVFEPESRTEVIPKPDNHALSNPANSAPELTDDEVTTADPIRRKRPGRQHDSVNRASTAGQRVSRSESPLFFPSPSQSLRVRSPTSVLASENSTHSPNKAVQGGRSKFLALVERHRKERIAREAAEIAKIAAHGGEDNINASRRARGSSPADDSSEDGMSADEGAIKRIQQQSRPTRKASKKAIEEMNRETQRMNRNMQLAHQARIRKKVTKESLLARFNFVVSGEEPLVQPATTKNPTASSSTTGSDAESANDHLTTPPTSPLHEAEPAEKGSDNSQVQDITHLLDAGKATLEMQGALAAGDEILDLGQTLYHQSISGRLRKLLDYHQHDTTVVPLQVSKTSTSVDTSDNTGSGGLKTVSKHPSRITLDRTLLRGQQESDSEIELEIIKSQGLKRKYAVFETLPKRKAKEMPSHLALRSLAYIIGNDDKKRSMNAAELEASLRRRARLQALDDRRLRIEELRAKGVVVQTTEERERDEQEVEDLVERARMEAVEIQKREKELAKRDGTYIKDNLEDEEDDSEDEDFEEEYEQSQGSGSEDDDNTIKEDVSKTNERPQLIDAEVEEAGLDEDTSTSQEEEDNTPSASDEDTGTHINRARTARNTRVILDDDDEEESFAGKAVQLPQLPQLAKTPQSAPRSARKLIPGLHMSDDLPMGLSQAFAATMADSQIESQAHAQEQDSFDLTADLPSPRLGLAPTLQRLDSVDVISDSQPLASQTQPLNVDLLSQGHVIPESPRGLRIQGAQYTPSQRQAPFDLTQDNGYILSPFLGNRFSDTPSIDIRSTVDTVVLPHGLEESPVAHRRGRLLRGRASTSSEVDGNNTAAPQVTAFQVMHQASKSKPIQQDFNKKKSEARNVVDDAAEESEDEYAGLGGVSDDSGDDEENDYDRQMIDEDTQIGKGDEAKLAGLYADRERERDEKEVSKLLKDITTGALRRKRGLGDDLELSDEEDAAARRREVKRREFAKMRRELLKDEAVGKIAEDKKKEAFLRSIEDLEEREDDDDVLEQPETEPESEGQLQNGEVLDENSRENSQLGQKRKRPLEVASDSKLNRLPPALRRTNPNLNRKPATLAEIRDSVSYLIEEPDSQAAMVDLGLSDSEDEPEAYVDLDRHLKGAAADEDRLEEDDEDLGDFIVDDDAATKHNSQDGVFKKPDLPYQERAPFAERRTKQSEVVDRLSLLRQASSSASSSTSSVSTTSKMAFFSAKAGGGFSGGPALLRRATTNSSLGSVSGKENVSATGVVTNKTERGNAGDEKEFIRKGSSGRRNAVNYQAERQTLREEKMNARAASRNNKNKKGKSFLGGLFRGDSWA